MEPINEKQLYRLDITDGDQVTFTVYINAVQYAHHLNASIMLLVRLLEGCRCMVTDYRGHIVTVINVNPSGFLVTPGLTATDCS
jgi:hypothetical protein